jgi:hypothetical protein
VKGISIFKVLTLFWIRPVTVVVPGIVWLTASYR